MLARLLLLVLGLLLASGASAQPVTSPAAASLEITTFNPRQLPVVQTPTNRVKTIVGRVAERTCLRNGGTQAACVAAGLYAGGNGLNVNFDWSWSQLATIAKSAGSTALANAAVGCAGGAAVGAIGAGAGAVPGCGTGALFGAVAGGFMGAVNGYYQVTSGIKADANNNGNVSGAGTQSAAPASAASQAAPVALYSAGQRTLLPLSGQTSQQLQTALAAIPINSSFVVQVQDGSGGFRRALRTQMVHSSQTLEQWFPLGGNTPYQCPQDQGWFPTDFNISTQAIVCQADSAGIPSGWTTQDRFAYAYVNNASSGSLCATGAGDQCNRGYSRGSQTYYYVNTSNTYSTAQSVPQVTFTTVVPTPIYAAGFGSSVKPDAINDPVTNATVAALVNAIKSRSAAGDPVPYDASKPTTAQDVADVIADDPANQMKLSDLMRPIANPEANGGTKTAPVPEPVTIANPSTSPSTSTGTATGTATNPTVTKEQTDTDLEKQDFGTLGNPIQPVIDFIAGPIAPFVNPKFSAPTGQCPVFGWDARPWFGDFLVKSAAGGTFQQGPVQAMARDFLHGDSQPACDFFNDHYAEIQQVLTLLLAMMAVFWFFER